MSCEMNSTVLPSSISCRRLSMARRRNAASPTASTSSTSTMSGLLWIATLKPESRVEARRSSASSARRSSARRRRTRRCDRSSWRCPCATGRTDRRRDRCSPGRSARDEIRRRARSAIRPGRPLARGRRRRPRHARDQLQQRRLAGAVWTDDAETRRRASTVEVEILHRPDVRVALAEREAVDGIVLARLASGGERASRRDPTNVRDRPAR